MGSEFAKALEVVLDHEGGLSTHKSDKGGITNFGISQRFLTSIGSTLDPKTITLEQATDLYRTHFWHPAYEKWNQLVADKVFDIAVNMGPKVAHLLLQRAVNDLRTNALVEDGRLGPKTIAAVVACEPQALVNALCDEQLERYRQIILHDPSQQVFWKGWLKRASWGKR